MSATFQDLRVWQEAMDLTVAIYKSSAEFPKHEIYGLAQQLRRAAVSVASNIAEGKATAPRKNFSTFSFTLADRFWKFRLSF